MRDFWCCLSICLLPLAPAPAADPDPEAPWVLGRLEPAWGNTRPRRTVQHRHDGARSNAENGEALAVRLGELQPGDRLEIGPGRHSVSRNL